MRTFAPEAAVPRAVLEAAVPAVGPEEGQKLVESLFRDEQVRLGLLRRSDCRSIAGIRP